MEGAETSSKPLARTHDAMAAAETAPAAASDAAAVPAAAAPPRKKAKAKAEFVPPPPPSKPHQCHFFVKRKHRYCSLAARKEKQYCGEHAHLEPAAADAAADADRRIPCPLDPNHTIQASQLAKHLERCNSRVVESPFRVPDVNLVRAPLPIPVRPLQERSRDEIADLVAKVQRAFAAMEAAEGGPIPLVRLDSKALDERRTTKKDLKHVNQQASLIGHLDRIGALSPDHVFVEFGAGKGELGHYVQRALGDGVKAPFYTVDRSNFRLKFDRYMDVERISLDIKDLLLFRVPSLLQRHGLAPPPADSEPSAAATAAPAPSVKPVVGFSKHLCGGATDLTLSCLHRYTADLAALAPAAAGVAGATPVHSILIALCCHHRCSVDTYVGDAWLAEHGLGIADLPVLAQMSGWAICGVRPPKRAGDDGEDAEEEDEHEHAAPEPASSAVGTPADEHYSGLSHADREQAGTMVKRILDYGRVRYLRAHGLDARLVYYVDTADSLENCALVATVPAPAAQG
ncbi:tRNA:m4X modification enzyme [Blastocladiella emersonii ATCC 22665]|nr:tRNA:m4X modification enzyme [Blastocladiella emersonii ATCC 22665]